MFVQERGNDLWLGAALPRYWLSDGQQIGIERAATYFGSVSLRMTSHVSEGYIEARVTPPQRNPPARTFVRFRHPEGRRITRCLINGTPCGSFDPEKEWVEMPRSDRPAKIVAIYD
jgi:hypothetical protein